MMSNFIDKILHSFGYTKEIVKEQEKLNNIIWEVGYNLTKEQIEKSKFKPFYEKIDNLTVESIGGFPKLGEYITFKYNLGSDKHGCEDFLYIRIKITRAERVVAGDINSFYGDVSGDVVTIHDRTYACILNLEKDE